MPAPPVLLDRSDTGEPAAAPPPPGRLGAAVRPAIVVTVGPAALLYSASRLGGLHPAVRSVSGADPRWLAVAACAAACSYIAAGVAQLGGLEDRARHQASGPAWLPRLALVQVACAFTNRLLPSGVGGMATNVRHLTRRGLNAREAGAAVLTTAAAGVLAHLLALLVALPFLLTLPPVRKTLLPVTPPVGQGTFTLGLVALLVVVLLARPPVPLRRPVAVGMAALARLGAALRQPRRAATLIGGSLGVTAAHAAAFLAASRAIGGAVPLGVGLAVYVTAVAAAGLVPTPGGAGCLDVALLAGLTAAGGASGPSAAAVLIFRLVTFWLPALPGAVVTLWLVRRRWL